MDERKIKRDKVICVRVDDDVHFALLHESRKYDWSVSHLVRNIVESFCISMEIPPFDHLPRDLPAVPSSPSDQEVSV